MAKNEVIVAIEAISNGFIATTCLVMATSSVTYLVSCVCAIGRTTPSVVCTLGLVNCLDAVGIGIRGVRSGFQDACLAITYSSASSIPTGISRTGITTSLGVCPSNCRRRSCRSGSRSVSAVAIMDGTLL